MYKECKKSLIFLHNGPKYHSTQNFWGNLWIWLVCGEKSHNIIIIFGRTVYDHDPVIITHTLLLLLLSLQPTVIGSLESLAELWFDMNTISVVPEVGYACNSTVLFICLCVRCTRTPTCKYMCVMSCVHMLSTCTPTVHTLHCKVHMCTSDIDQCMRAVCVTL